MRNYLHNLRSKRYAFAAILSGIMLGLAFPAPSFFLLGWILPGALFIFCSQKTSLNSSYQFQTSTPFQFGWLCGLSFWLFTLRWLLCIPFPSGAFTSWITLSSYLALYFAVWCWMIKKYTTNLPLLISSIFAASLWITLEWIRGFLFTGFAWNMLYVSQHEISSLIWMSSITGGYGISFLMVALSVSCWGGFIKFIRSSSTVSYTVGNNKPFSLFVTIITSCKEAILLSIILILCICIGINQNQKTLSKNRSDNTYKIAQIQPSIPQTLIWDSEANKEQFSHMIKETRSILSTNTIDLLIFPEAAIPGYIRYDHNIAQKLRQLAIDFNTPILFCSDDAEPNKKNPSQTDFFNCAFLMDENGILTARYIKRHLVMFGEYIPLITYIPFLRHFSPISGNYTAGNENTSFPWPTKKQRSAPLICFDDSFPEEVRHHVQNNVSVFICLINAGWFMESIAHWQHLANTRFRSIENGIPSIRSCNNGITCWIDDTGNIHDIFRDQNGSVYGKGYQIIQFTIPNSAESGKNTFYNRHGPWFVYLSICLIISVTGNFYLLKYQQLRQYPRAN